MSDQTVIHVISHTHWDREWHQDFQGFRRRLVGLIDHLLDILAERPDYRYYHLDGQTCPLADYMDIRPEREAEVRGHIESGRLIIGPFFILPDEFLVSGEATVRNLLLGHREAREWGGEPMGVGYIPDTFGHISQMPQILRGFGIDNALLFRGVTYDQVKSEFIWEGPDGSQVLCLKMPDEFAYSSFFYENQPIITAHGDAIDAEAAVENMRRIRDKALEVGTTDHVLAMDGVDHIYPSVKTLGIIEAANAGLEDAEVIHTSLAEYVAAVSKEVEGLEIWRGEMRTANRAFRLQALLAATLSSWMPLKQENWACQTELERWAEPMAALAGAYGTPLDPERGFLRESWRELLINHPHDSICGCSIDEVHNDMRYRSRQSLKIARDSATRGMEALAENIDTSWVPEGAEAVVICNPLGWPRRELIEADIDFPADRNVQWFRLIDADGTEVPLQRISSEGRGVWRQAPHGIPHVDPVTRHKVGFVTDIPGLGYKVLAAVPSDEPIRTQLPTRNVPENPFMLSNFELTTSLRFEDGGDVGDGYNYVRPERDAIVTGLVRPDVIEAAGPIFERRRCELTLDVPASATQDAKGRSDGTVPLKVTVWETTVQPRGDRFYRVRVDNNARDHRLRMVWELEAPDTPVSSFAESQFDVVQRPIVLPDTSDWREEQPPFWPQQSFCGVHIPPDMEMGVFESRTVCVANRGLPEYEVSTDGDAVTRIEVTLLRCIGRGVGQPEQFVDSQLQGTHEFHLALFSDDDVEEPMPWIDAHNFNAPLRVTQTGRHKGDLPPAHSFVCITPPELCVTTLKPAEDRDSLILRLVNYGAEQQARISPNIPVQAIYRCNLAEERQEELGEEPITVGHCEIVTIEFEL